MRPLEKSLRSKLEDTVKEAREEAEAAARAVLEQLGVGEAAPFAHLNESERELRRRLRIHGHQLGDRRDSKSHNPSIGKQEIDRLSEEVAYEHWHRMLFARFLAENDLLMYEDVAISLEECEELAADEGLSNGWQLAARLASKMLPQIFRPDSPVFQLGFPPERQQKLERLVAGLPREVFAASDSLGWVYQFWQARRKDEVNASEVKIGARELPAVTQLFTEPYMVAFLLDNSLGAWWAMRRLTEADLRTAESEAELRAMAALPGVPLEYLRFVKSEDGTWTPAAGTFASWPEQLSELKMLDPCCGSGHFLVAALLMLVPLRMELEALSACDAVDAVLSQNLHGLELDQRCVELAAFALALTAWRYHNTGGYRMLPELNLACSGLAISAKRGEWLALASGNVNLSAALETLYKLFNDAPVLGSLINPEISLAKGSLFELKWEDVGPLLNKALSGERDDEKTEMGVIAKGIAKAATLMTFAYQLVITNVPYLGREGHAQELKDFADAHLAIASGDLATLMLERIFEYMRGAGVCCLVLPQNWWVGRSYARYRENIIRSRRWLFSVVLGEEAWGSFGNRGPNTVLVGIASSPPPKDNTFSAIDLSSKPNKPIVTREEKIIGLKNETHDELGVIFSVSQESQLNNPDFRISLHPLKTSKLLNIYVISGEGCSTGDADRFLRYYWEVKWDSSWIAYLSPDGMSNPWGGREMLMLWEGGTGELAKSPQARIQNTELWEKKGVLVGRVRGISTTLFDGGSFSKGAVLICPKNGSDLGAIYHFLKSKEYEDQVRALDPRVSASTSVLTKVGFEVNSGRTYLLPKKISNNPTQWIFHGHPAPSDDPLQVAVIRLLGYRWPAELNKEMDLSDESREWVERAAALDGYADEDGILCLPAVRGEAPAADRLLGLLAAAYGEAWSTQTLGALLTSAGHEGKSLETWLRDKFFAQHCALFHHRPFIWHIWDGLRDGFAALVNYHKLDGRLLETLIYTYLGDWITRQKQDRAGGVDGSEEKLAAAEALKKRLELILEGEAPYDIFVRWKPIEQQPIGWEPDLNDGVRLNIRPFLSVPDVGRKGAGVLRDKPNVKWEKDRGKDVETAPWYKVFGGDRINDYHLKIEEKQAARKGLKGSR
ncbi:MAG: DNA methyltransferase [Blastocatellia bacterium]|nr:DNA methyltransferase [Blastocatellia bacterium]